MVEAFVAGAAHNQQVSRVQLQLRIDLHGHDVVHLLAWHFAAHLAERAVLPKGLAQPAPAAGIMVPLAT